VSVVSSYTLQSDVYITVLVVAVALFITPNNSNSQVVLRQCEVAFKVKI